MVADGKVYLGTRRGDFSVFGAAQEQQILATIDLRRARQLDRHGRKRRPLCRHHEMSLRDR